MYAFENIGFTKPCPETQKRYLCCAGCEYGPLGVVRSVQDKSVYLVACDKVLMD